MDAGAIFVSIGSLFVAGLSLWLAHKERSSEHRQHMYERQAEAFADVLDALHPLYNSVQQYLVPHMAGMDAAARVAFRKALYTGDLWRLQMGFAMKHQHSAVFMPSSVHVALNGFTRTLNGLSAPPGMEGQYPEELVDSRDPQGDLGKAYEQVLQSARHALGVEPLSREILKLVGTTPDALELGGKS